MNGRHKSGLVLNEETALATHEAITPHQVGFAGGAQAYIGPFFVAGHDAIDIVDGHLENQYGHFSFGIDDG